MGMLYSVHGQYDQALDYLQRNAKIREEWATSPARLKRCTVSASSTCSKGLRTVVGLELRALKPAEALGNNELLGDILQNISEAYLRTGQYQSASEYAERAATLANRIGIPEIFGRHGTWPERHSSH